MIWCHVVVLWYDVLIRAYGVLWYGLMTIQSCGIVSILHSAELMVS